MPTIFSTQPGIVVAIDEVTGIPFRMAGWSGFEGMKSIITGVTISAEANVQFLHSLREYIYIYVFGDRIADLQVTGLAFADRCPGGGGSGIEATLSYYNQYKVSSTGTPVAIQLGNSMVGRLNGFLVATPQFSIADPERLLAQFSLTFKVPPTVNSRRTSSGGGNSSGSSSAPAPGTGAGGATPPGSRTGMTESPPPPPAAPLTEGAFNRGTATLQRR